MERKARIITRGTEVLGKWRDKEVMAMELISRERVGK